MKPLWFILVLLTMLAGINAAVNGKWTFAIVLFALMWFFTYLLQLEDYDAR